MKVKEQSEKIGLNHNIQKTKIIASGPITSWQIDGETVETVTYFIFLGSKNTAGGDCSHEIQRCLWRRRRRKKKEEEEEEEKEKEEKEEEKKKWKCCKWKLEW